MIVIHLVSSANGMKLLGCINMLTTLTKSEYNVTLDIVWDAIKAAVTPLDKPCDHLKFTNFENKPSKLVLE